MLKHKSLSILKWVAPACAVAFSLLAFTNQTDADKIKSNDLFFADLYFKYTPTDPDDFSQSSVEEQSNWTLITSGQKCEQETNEVPCSFSITVETGQQASYLDGTHPSSRVNINTSGSSSQAYVSQLEDATTSDDITQEIDNIELPQ
ncbi:hypothetical protein [Niabella ginsengisoli]|uniref:Uncharacterized protein n=1 Tax=Niabella ginsengisoli TaxID=522298 RepID=A0ABS9SIF8_9BACT|nr:hypothetical protein [Niabella ginsengisoli]MCH5597949.1 hypothetical protein [Niabella ginsengisoli]